MKLPQSTITDALNAYKLYGSLVDQINKRMSYILEFCMNQVNGKLDWWDWTDEKEFPNAYSPETLNITGVWTPRKKMTFIDKNGNECNIEYGDIPTRWIYEDFEEEFTNGIKLYQDKRKEQIAKDTEKQQKKKQEKDALIAAAKAKLTPEELKALKNAQ